MHGPTQLLLKYLLQLALHRQYIVQAVQMPWFDHIDDHCFEQVNSYPLILAKCPRCLPH